LTAWKLLKKLTTGFAGLGKILYSEEEDPPLSSRRARGFIAAWKAPFEFQGALPGVHSEKRIS